MLDIVVGDHGSSSTSSSSSGTNTDANVNVNANANANANATLNSSFDGDGFFVIPSKHWVMSLDPTKPQFRVPVVKLLTVLTSSHMHVSQFRSVLIHLLHGPPKHGPYLYGGHHPNGQPHRGPYKYGGSGFGLDPNTVTALTANEAPLLFSLLTRKDIRHDVELLEAFVKANASTKPMVRSWDSKPPEGVSLLHLVAFPHQTAVICQAFLQEVGGYKCKC